MDESSSVAQGHADAWRELLDVRRADVSGHVRTGTLGPIAVEAERACSAWLLSACEDIYRSGEIDPRIADLFERGSSPTGRELCALVDPRQAAELAELAIQLETSGVLARLRELGGNTRPGEVLGIAAPTIVAGWAVGELIVGAIDPDRGVPPLAGATLVAVKTPLRSCLRTCRVGSGDGGADVAAGSS
jgi:hypothetical protein